MDRHVLPAAPVTRLLRPPTRRSHPIAACLREDLAMTELTKTEQQTSAQAGAWQRLWPALAAGLLGLVILYGTGFAPLHAHNAAHDARHAAGMPCH